MIVEGGFLDKQTIVSINFRTILNCYASICDRSSMHAYVGGARRARRTCARTVRYGVDNYKYAALRYVYGTPTVVRLQYGLCTPYLGKYVLRVRELFLTATVPLLNEHMC